MRSARRNERPGLAARVRRDRARSLTADQRSRRAGIHHGIQEGEGVLALPARQVLRLVTNLTAFRALQSVILIDEVELHLHPTWQRKLVHFMRKGGGDDNQLIVTTHSESIANTLHPDEVMKLGALDEPGSEPLVADAGRALERFAG